MKKSKGTSKKTDFLFYPRQRIEGIVENNEEKIENSIVKKHENGISLEEKAEKKTNFISKQ